MNDNQYCTATLGVLVIVLAWWKVAWAPIALTVSDPPTRPGSS